MFITVSVVALILFAVVGAFYVQSKLDALTTRANSIRGDFTTYTEKASKRFENALARHKKLLGRFEESAGGGLWRTKSGDLLRIRDMTTAQIQANLDNEAGSEEKREAMAAELDRRFRMDSKEAAKKAAEERKAEAEKRNKEYEANLAASKARRETVATLKAFPARTTLKAAIEAIESGNVPTPDSSIEV